MKPSLVIVAILMGVVAADVSHLAGRYNPPAFHLQRLYSTQGLKRHKQRPPDKHYETTIEMHEIVELPTEIEIVRGEHEHNSKQETVPSTGFSPNEIEPLQPPQSMAIQTYLRPVSLAANTASGQTPATLVPASTTDRAVMEDTNTEAVFGRQQDVYKLSMTPKEMLVQDAQLCDATSASLELRAHKAWAPPNQYAPPSSILLPPSANSP